MSSQGPEGNGLSPSEKRELLARLLATGSAPASVSPLTHGQRALWSLHEGFPESAAYNVAFAARLDAGTDGSLIRRALQYLVDRHPALRTRIVPSGGEPYQHVDRASVLDYAEHDARGWPADRLHAHLTVSARRPFSLERGPVLRTELLRGGERDVLLVVLHHIAGDFWSLGVLVDELRVVYGALRSGSEPALPPLRSTYADFVRFQADLLAGDRGDALWQYWRSTLEGASTALDLPCDRPRPAVPTFDGREYVCGVQPDVAAAARRMARDASATLYVVLLGVFGVLLHRYSGQPDILVGVPASGRTRPEFAPVVGYFVNLLPVRVSCDGDPAFRALLARLRDAVAGGMEHQDLPFPVLVDRLEAGRDASRAPLVQAVLNMPRAHRVQGTADAPFEPTAGGLSLRVGEIGLEQFPIEQRTSVFELSLTVLEMAGGGLSLAFQYNTDLFEPQTVERMAAHYVELLRAAAERPDTRTSRLTLDRRAPPAERVPDARTQPGAAANHACVSELIEERARQDPAGIAIVHEAEAVTYGQLSARSRELARALTQRGVGPGTTVAICLHPGADLVVSILGVLRAGAAYVPQDPAYPADRLARMLEVSQALLVIADQGSEQAVPACGLPIVRCSDCVRAAQPAPSDWTPRTPDPDSAAYVIFTSGSTGDPKGVVVTRRNLLFSTAARLAYYDEPPRRFLLLSSPAFDSSVAGIFWTLAAGGTLRFGLRAHGEPADPRALAAVIRDSAITHTLCVPSLYGALLDEIAEAHPAHLRTVIVAGEACPQSLVDRHDALLPDTALFNEYGPTEASVWSTVYRCRAGEPRSGVPIGVAIPGARVHLLDAHQQPVPDGVPGEIYVAGPGVAQGYVRRPDLTAAAFLPDPFAGNGQRMYRTGDRARTRNGRDLEFLGRLDEQFKLRGWRIEPGEVSALLRQHPAVRDAVVCAVSQSSGAPALAAYVESDGVLADGLAQDQVRQWQAVYDQSYRQRDAYLPADPSINLSIWTSSYTRAPLPADEIRASVDEVADRVLALRPRRVLEIGCGTGMLLARVAPRCREYRGWDFSEPALARARELVQARGLTGVTLEQRSADALDGAGSFDAVVLNEVAQHFPSIEYLHRVLERAVALLSPGGFVFLGGVRHLELMEAFHASVELQSGPASATRAELRLRTERRISGENELFVHPAFFDALPVVMPGVAGVSVEMKRGARRNEITRFKFNAIVYAGHATGADAPRVRVDWPASGLDVPQLNELLATPGGELALHDIPNARLVDEARALKWLRGQCEARTAGELRSAPHPDASVDPEDLARLGERHGFVVRLLWSDDPWRFDAVFTRAERRVCRTPGTARAPALANDPLRPSRAVSLVAELRALAGARLPAFMVPAHFVVLARLPRGPNGKVDRRALPRPEAVAAGERTAIAPRTPVERALAHIWAETLGLNDVGIADSFFALGGDSILVIQMVGRARRAGIHFTPRQVFEHETIERLAAVAAQAAAPATDSARAFGPIPLTPIQRWFFDNLPAQPGACCQAVLLQPVRLLDPDTVEAALRAVAAHHDATHLAFRRRGRGWEQSLESADAAQLSLRRVPDGSEAAIDREVTLALASMALDAPPLWRAVLFEDPAGGRARLLLLAHHLVVDAISWHVIVADLATALEQIERGEPIALPANPTSFAAWARELEGRTVRTTPTRGQRSEEVLSAPPRPAGVPTGEQHAATPETLVVTLPADDTARLLATTDGHGSVEQLLLRGLARALHRRVRPANLRVHVERHGRHDADVDLSRTVGWLTTIVPVDLELPDDADPAAIDGEVARQSHILSQRATGREGSSIDEEADVVVNYLGRIDRLIDGDSLFRLAPEMERVRARLAGPGRYPLALDALIAGDTLRVEWSFRTPQFTREAVEGIAADVLEGLQDAARGRALDGAPSNDAGGSRAIASASQAATVDTYRLTPVQEGLLFYALAEGRSRAYFGQVAFRIDGSLDPAALQDAWSATLARHPVLRTSFAWAGAAGPMQHVRHRVDAAVVTRRLEAGEGESVAFERCMAADRELGFDPARAPLTRLTHLPVGSDRHWIVWSHHHLVLDGWSIPIVLADLFAGYRAALGLRRSAAPPPRPFRDYVAWLARQDARMARDYWRRTFAGWNGPPPGRPPLEASDDRGEAAREVPCRNLGVLARRQRLTLNTVVQGAWALVLGRREATRDVVLGVTSAGRPFDLDGSDRMVGPFINTLPFRVTLPAGERVDTWLRQLQARQAEMRQFEHCPLADVRTWIGAPGSGALFDALIVYENYPIDVLLTNELGPLGIGDVRFTAWNHYPLTLRVVPHEDCLVLALLHDRRVVADGQALEMLADLEAALSAIALGMDREVGELDRLAAWASPSPEQVEASAHRSAEAMLIAARRRTAEP